MVMASFLVVLLTVSACRAFQPVTPRQHEFQTRRYGFFKDMLDGAFDNDRSLSSQDKLKGMIVGPNAVEPDSIAAPTETQRAWRERQTNVQSELAVEMLENSKFSLALYLSGIPSKDPSNDLYGSRVNISNRNKELGIDVPEEPNVKLDIEFLSNGVCRCSESPFTTGEVDGEWKLSDDGTQLRFSMDVLGYSRMIQTRGSIQKVFWSEEPEVTSQTSSEYAIPPGMVYGDVVVGSGNQPGLIAFKGVGALRVEQQMGLLGVASKMVTVGTFQAEQQQQQGLV